MKLIIFLVTTMLALPSMSIAATMKGKIVRNMTDLPFSAFKIHVESNFDGGNSEAPVSVNNDGTFKIKTSSFWRQNISLSINGKKRLHIVDNGGDASKKLNAISIIQFNSHDGEISLTSGEDVDSWMKKNLAYGKIQFEIFAISASFKSTFEGPDFFETTSSKYTMPEQFALFTSEEEFKKPVDLNIEFRTAEDGLGGVEIKPLKRISYKGPIHRDMFSSLNAVELSPEGFNIDPSGVWTSYADFSGRYSRRHFTMDIVCRDGVLSGSVKTFSPVDSPVPMPDEEAVITNGKCNGQDITFTIPMTLLNYETNSPVSEVRYVDFKFQYVSKYGISMRISFDSEHVATTNIPRL